MSRDGLWAAGIFADNISDVPVSGIGHEGAMSGPGHGEDIFVTAKYLTVEGGGWMSASSWGSGTSGTIHVTATERLTLNGRSPDGGWPSALIANAQSEASDAGDAGNLVLVTKNLTLGEGAQITTSTSGSGQGGTLTVNATGPVALTGPGSGLFTVSEASGTGGNINVRAARMTMDNGASVSAASSGTGDAGTITINVGSEFLSSNSSVTTEATQASGGNITLLASDMVHLRNSQISASVADGRGGGGNISIDPQFVLLQNSQILAQAAQGQGGAITITAGLFLPDANSNVNADSGSGVNGTVTIQSPNAPIIGQIQPLGKTPLIATSLLNQSCASLTGGEFSSFTVAGRDSLPTEPGSWLSSPLAFGSAGFSGGAVAEAGTQSHVIDPAQETTALSLRQIAPAGFLTQAFTVDKPAGCKT